MADILSIEKTVLPSHARRAVHLAAISRAIKGEYVVSGGYVQQHASVADMSVDVDAITSYRYGGSDLSLSAATVAIEAADEELHKLAQLIRYSSNIALMCGSGCAGAHQELVEFAAKIKAPVVHALRGKGVERA